MTSHMYEELRIAVEKQMPQAREDLGRLVSIPSIAFPGFDHADVRRCADVVAGLFREAGIANSRVVSAGGQPAVVGYRRAPAGAPTVLLYAHHDVQPIGDRREWETDPFEAVERNGRLFGRGCADDKAGIMAHLVALRVLGDTLPVGVAILVEGEEECGSSSLDNVLRAHGEGLIPDVIVIADSGNWDVGHPALTTTLRGIITAFIEVRTLHHPVHSGFFGGAVPDALTALCRLLATMHHESGEVAVDGLLSTSADSLDYSLERLRAESGILEGVELIGAGPIVERLWTKPSLSVLGVDAPPAADAPTALVPCARAKIGLRIAPGDTVDRAFAALSDHVNRHVPWGAKVSVTLDEGGEACSIDTSSPVFGMARAALAEAWGGVTAVDIGIGGSIPFVATLQEKFPSASIVVTGVEDPHSHAHGPNESLHLADFEKGCLAEALFLARLSDL